VTWLLIALNHREDGVDEADVRGKFYPSIVIAVKRNTFTAEADLA
jgi:hypothetical protein